MSTNPSGEDRPPEFLPAGPPAGADGDGNTVAGTGVGARDVDNEVAGKYASGVVHTGRPPASGDVSSTTPATGGKTERQDGESGATGTPVVATAGDPVKAPGTATAAGLMGIVFGAGGFILSSLQLMMWSSSWPSWTGSGGRTLGINTLVLLLGAAVALAASVTAFVGGVRLLSGFDNKWVRLSSAIYGAALALFLVGHLLDLAWPARTGPWLVYLVTQAVLAGLLFTMASGDEVEAWLTRRGGDAQ